MRKIHLSEPAMPAFRGGPADLASTGHRSRWGVPIPERYTSSPHPGQAPQEAHLFADYSPRGFSFL